MPPIPSENLGIDIQNVQVAFFIFFKLFEPSPKSTESGEYGVVFWVEHEVKHKAVQGHAQVFRPPRGKALCLPRQNRRHELRPISNFGARRVVEIRLKFHEKNSLKFFKNHELDDKVPSCGRLGQIK